MKEHLILGFGKWGNVVFNEIKDKNYFEKIYLYSRKKNFIYISKEKKLKPLKEINLKKKYYSTHICTPVEKHFEYYRKTNAKKTIIEKPAFKNKKEFRFKKKYIVNYSDLFSPNLNKVYKEFAKLKKGEFILNYKNKTLKYKKIHKFDIEYFSRKKINNYLCENININFLIKGFKIKLVLKTDYRKKKLRELNICGKNKKIRFNFYNSSYKISTKRKRLLYTSDKNAINNLYENYILKNNNYNFEKNNFSKKIYDIKSEILKYAKKTECK
jgi:hypothetical protein